MSTFYSTLPHTYSFPPIKGDTPTCSIHEHSFGPIRGLNCHFWHTANLQLSIKGWQSHACRYKSIDKIYLRYRNITLASSPLSLLPICFFWTPRGPSLMKIRKAAISSGPLSAFSWKKNTWTGSSSKKRARWIQRLVIGLVADDAEHWHALNRHFADICIGSVHFSLGWIKTVAYKPHRSLKTVSSKLFAMLLLLEIILKEKSRLLFKHLSCTSSCKCWRMCSSCMMKYSPPQKKMRRGEEKTVVEADTHIPGAII